MSSYRIKLIQAGTQHYIDGRLNHDEAEVRMDIEEATHRSAGWLVSHPEDQPGAMVLRRGGLERIIQLELDG